MRRSSRSGTIRHSASHSRPANSPSAANSRPGCGPESPIGIGSGGSSSAAPKNSASQRAGFCRVHQSTGTITAGAASSGFHREAGRHRDGRRPHAEQRRAHQAGLGCALHDRAISVGRGGPACADRSPTSYDRLLVEVGVIHRAPCYRAEAAARQRDAPPGSSSPGSDTGWAAPGPPAAPPPH